MTSPPPRVVRASFKLMLILVYDFRCSLLLLLTSAYSLARNRKDDPISDPLRVPQLKPDSGTDAPSLPSFSTLSRRRISLRPSERV